ncbi:MAG: hypothetical protein A3G05_01735 [Candidatus Zambryskibacteria bacterium RIFCSPLOWO2_12_FULL_45_14]|uniref:Uncharacterized protein n=2 Tax=Candidatus Zambryskiibacteriota TaxID=1817925 RepID=A0A1G2UMJ0_9BACT|nr:MAG: hypothetical protein A3H60_00320 [Candidatus Zambryskibacteria bacterium RIFCSPLOWO2_02_FULL_44_12b]OHB14073.1 MAG: hypothetical protein A3G05_01735 [Candidatus Zambryskibacteria bacterium RIFCSPLOWO2_12_FULL_45_14]
MNKGSSILEVLIAIAILTLGISAAIMLVFGNQSLQVDNDTNSEALYKAKAILERARASSTVDFLSINSLPSATSSIYSLKLDVLDLTPCRKEANSTITWLVSPLRTQIIELVSDFTDIATALAMGGDCTTEPPESNWDNPQRFASDTFSPGKPTAIDVLNRIVYVGVDTDPFLFIADTSGATLGQNGGFFMGFTNGFTTEYEIAAIDVISFIDGGINKNYAYLAVASSTRQLMVVDVTDIFNPTLVTTRQLNNVSSGGSFPEGYRIFVYKDRLYIVTRETSGREFHIFNISDRSNPIELGGGTDINTTLNSLVVRDQIISGITIRFAYAASTLNNGEVLVYDVTDPANNGTIVEVAGARQDLPGSQDGESMYIIGNKLYFGRQSTPSGPDLYIYNTSNPNVGMIELGSKDIDTGVLDILAVGNLSFLATPKTTKEFQVWNISNPANITLIKEYNFGNIVEQGVEYEPDFIYTTGQATPNFQILYSP